MALGHSPQIVTNGLVFAYDMGNSKKSWKGAPTTNYFYYSEDFTNAQWTRENNLTVTANAAVAPDGTNTANLVTFPTANLPRIYQTRSELGGQNAVLSVWIKSATSSNQSVALWLRQSGFGTTYTSGSFTATQEWQRVYVTAAIPAGVSVMGMFYQSDTASPTNTVYMWGGQLEVGTYPSSYIKSVASYGTRSNTQALVDLTGQNTITANSLTYASDGTFSFDGTNNYASVVSGTNFTFGTGDFALEAWYNPSVSYAAGNGYIFDTSSNGTRLQLYQNNLSLYLQSQVASVLAPAGSGITPNNWYHVVGTRIGTTLTLYLNGVSIATGTSSASLSDNAGTIGNYGGGGAYKFAGKIASVKVYKNKGLTAAEVNQNFNAYKERFFGYQKLTYVGSSNVTLTNNGTEEVTMFKTASNNAWDSHVYSNEAFTAPCTIEFTKNAGATDNGVSYAMIGWNADPTTDQSYSSLDWASYPYMSNTYSVYHNGTQVLASGTWDPNKRFYIVYDTDGYIRHYNGSTLLYSVNKGTGQTVYVDSSFYSVNATYGGFTGVKVCRKSWNGTSYV